MKDPSLKNPGLPKYFSAEFIQTIQQAIEQKMDVVRMSSKEWYSFLLKKNVLEEMGQDDTVVKKKCKAEQLHPTRDWPETWGRARSKGLTNESRSFLFRLLHNLLPTKARLHRMNPRVTPQPFCSYCEGQEKEENLNHVFSSECNHSAQVMDWLKSVLLRFDPNATFEKILALQLEPANSDCQLECIFITAETLSIIWEKRQSNRVLGLDNVKAIVSAKAETLRKSAIFGASGTNLMAMLALP